MDNLYVVKLGSSTILNRPEIFGEIHGIVQRGSRVLLVAGGAEGIKRKYESLGREMPFLTLPGGDEVRYCSPEEMPVIRAAYHEIIIAEAAAALRSYGLSVFAQNAGDNQVVTGTKAKPLKVVKDGKTLIVRDSLFGSYAGSHTGFLKSALAAYDVVVLTPPIYDPALGGYINIDADVLAAHLAVDLGAQHLRFVTGTPGILQNIEDADSTIRHVYQGDELPWVQGRMKQKVRAASIALEQGTGDVSITGPHTLEGKGRTWFWNFPRTAERSRLDLLAKVTRIASVSGDERELASFLLEEVRYPGVSGSIDEAGNIVFRKGNGPRRLLLLGHIDTVPYQWQVKNDEEGLTGRGVVDAKGSFVNFVHMLEEAEVPEHGTLLVIGAVEEEVSSSKGAHYVRDHYGADAVIIGEPSGENSLTLGYYGLFKLQITISRLQEHTAAKDSISVIDELYGVVDTIRRRVRESDPDSLSSLIDVKHTNERGLLTIDGTLNFRISPAAGREYSGSVSLDDLGEDVRVEVLRATPGYANPRNDALVKSFVRSFAKEGKSIHYIKKRGTSDMNTLATTWEGIPMVAYGPGDSSLDHTNREYLHHAEALSARAILREAVNEWFRLGGGE
ncbi:MULTISPECIES: M20/M25/M40 family metallo-hydrolase [Paenibacillus]|uniref:M20/M25/M40 family metallo-hydrolase n=1 Tax=Paenibacillus TaxID=44249 RepID=UPI0022B915B4|nr:M20/M25/M40 family metallo-hydrolase [Paenibacillus caseinilyticus]MCZ8521674.1 M20/M25/M40 family metallo-hydrolase [Paenibacillus caseinilyticus]